MKLMILIKNFQNVIYIDEKSCKNTYTYYIAT